MAATLGFFESLNKVDNFTATWMNGSDNYQQFMKNISVRGVSDATAALNTWSGINIAQQYGFIHLLKKVEIDRNNEYVIAKFSRIKPEDNLVD